MVTPVEGFADVPPLTLTAKSVAAYAPAAGFTTFVMLNVVAAAVFVPAPRVTASEVPLTVVDVIVVVLAIPPVEVVTGVANVVPVGNVTFTTSPETNTADGVKPTVHVPLWPARTEAAAGAKLTDETVEVVPAALAMVANPRRTIAIATTLTANLFTRSIGLKPGELPDPTFE
ncbi:MAG TPA: hypothetical protein PLG60_02515 [Acidimicrobiales bacterium]|nr:hypothetical protein [Acidimicrobiales bacterium]